MIGWSPRCYIPSFKEIGLPVLEKKISKGLYQIWAWRPSCHVTIIMSSDFHFLVPESFHKKNLVQIGKVVSEKIRFEILYVHDIGTRSSNDLDLQYSVTFIFSIRCLFLPTFRSLAAIVSENSTVFTFSYRKACYKFDLAVK